MARKTHKDIAEDAVQDLLVKMLHIYNQSIDKMTSEDKAPEKVNDVKALIDSGCRLIGFLEPRTHTQAQIEGGGSDPAKLKQAFGKLLANQRKTKPDHT